MPLSIKLDNVNRVLFNRQNALLLFFFRTQVLPSPEYCYLRKKKTIRRITAIFLYPKNDRQPSWLI